MRLYKFRALCNSGIWKDFEFEASNYTDARKILDQLVKDN